MNAQNEHTQKQMERATDIAADILGGDPKSLMAVLVQRDDLLAACEYAEGLLIYNQLKGYGPKDRTRHALANFAAAIERAIS